MTCFVWLNVRADHRNDRDLQTMFDQALSLYGSAFWTTSILIACPIFAPAPE